MDPAPKRQKLMLATNTVEQTNDLNRSQNIIDGTASQSTTSSIQYTQSALLGLPLDIRLVVYDFVFGDARIDIDVVESGWQRVSEPTYNSSLRAAASILLVNNQIRRETLPFFAKMEITVFVASRLYPYGAIQGIITVPAILQTRITRLELVSLILCFKNWVLPAVVKLANLRNISVRHRICHFQEVERPAKDDPEINKRFSEIMRKRYYDATYTVQQWESENDGSHQIGDVFVVWFLNTQRSLSHGWEVKMKSMNGEVISVTTKSFRKRKFHKYGQMSADKEAAASLAWKYSADGWSSSEGWFINEFGTGISEEEQSKYLPKYTTLEWNP